MDKEGLLALIRDDARVFNAINALRNSFSPLRFNDVRIPNATPAEAIKRGIRTVQETLTAYDAFGLKVDDMDPGHGVGHLARDYINALRLTHMDYVTDPSHLFVGFVGGVLHDMGNAIVERYEEGKRVTRHGEAGALLFNEATKDLDLNDAERTLIAHSIAAHTHYLKPLCVKGVDGIERTLPPYQDTDEEGKPVMGVWLPRWIDRLDCNGSAFLGRHFLTLVNPRDEFDGEKFYQTDIVSALNPLLRPEVEIKVAGAHPLTMREHLRRYARTQSNNSPYGKHDNGTMQSLRDTNTTALNAIIGAVDRDALLGSSDIEHILGRWTTFLSGNVEPSMLGRHAAEKMRSKFGELDESTRRAWASGFDQALETYRVWAAMAKSQVGEIIGSDEEAQKLPLLNKNVFDVLKPAY